MLEVVFAVAVVRVGHQHNQAPTGVRLHRRSVRVRRCLQDIPPIVLLCTPVAPSLLLAAIVIALVEHFPVRPVPPLLARQFDVVAAVGYCSGDELAGEDD